MIYRNAFHGMTEAEMAEYGAALPTDKDGINAAGRTICEHNAHVRAARLARLVSYFASNADAPEAGEGEMHDAALSNARQALATAEGEVSEAEYTAEMTPEGERVAILAKDAASNARPFPMGDVEDSRAMLARLGVEGAAPAAPVAPVGAPLSVLASADARAARTLPACTCDAPRAQGETWRAFYSRRKGCEGCAARRAHPTMGILPALAPTADAAWEGMQGDRVAARGRSPAVASNGIGARRMGPRTL